jgi:regulatory protein
LKLAVETDAELKRIKQECLRLLTRREHSRLEIAQKLAGKGFNEKLTDAVLNELTQSNWQDDKRFAEGYVRQRRSRGFGPQRIAYELQQRGVEVDAINAITQSTEQGWLEQLEQVCQKKFPNPAEMTFEQRGKCFRFLLQRGFSGDMIKTYFKQASHQST